MFQQGQLVNLCQKHKSCKCVLIICRLLHMIVTERYWKIIFTARRVRIARTMPWQDVCPSIRHMLVLCVNGYTYPQSFFTIG